MTLSSACRGRRAAGSRPSPSHAHAALHRPQHLRAQFDSAIFTIDPNLRTPYVQQWNPASSTRSSATRWPRCATSATAAPSSRAASTSTSSASSPAGSSRTSSAPSPTSSTAAGERTRRRPSARTGSPSRCSRRSATWPSTSPPFLTRAGRGGQGAGLLHPEQGFFFPEFGGAARCRLLSTYLPNPNAYVSDYVGNCVVVHLQRAPAEIRQRLRGGFDFQAELHLEQGLHGLRGQARRTSPVCST